MGFRVPNVDLSAVLQPNNFDGFTDTNGVSLDAHSPNVGGAWTEQVGSWDIQSNKAQVTGTPGTNDIATVDASVADVIADCVVTPRSTDASNRQTPAVVVRYTDATHYWMLNVSAYNNTLYLYEVNAGYTVRASTGATINDNTAYTARMIADGQTIDGFLDGGSKISYGSAALNETETVHGLRNYETGTPPGSSNYDNFAIYPRRNGIYDAELDAV